MGRGPGREGVCPANADEVVKPPLRDVPWAETRLPELGSSLAFQFEARHKDLCPWCDHTRHPSRLVTIKSLFVFLKALRVTFHYAVNVGRWSAIVQPGNHFLISAKKGRERTCARPPEAPETLSLESRRGNKDGGPRLTPRA